MIPDHGKMLLNHTNNPNHPHLQVKGRKKPDKVFHTGYIGTYIVVRQQSARRQPWGWRLNLFYMEPGGAAPW